MEIINKIKDFLKLIYMFIYSYFFKDKEDKDNIKYNIKDIKDIEIYIDDIKDIIDIDYNNNVNTDRLLLLNLLTINIIKEFACSGKSFFLVLFGLGLDIETKPLFLLTVNEVNLIINDHGSKRFYLAHKDDFIYSNFIYSEIRCRFFECKYISI